MMMQDKGKHIGDFCLQVSGCTRDTFLSMKTACALLPDEEDDDDEMFQCTPIEDSLLLVSDYNPGLFYGVYVDEGMKPFAGVVMVDHLILMIPWEWFDGICDRITDPQRVVVKRRGRVFTVFREKDEFEW